MSNAEFRIFPRTRTEQYLEVRRPQTILLHYTNQNKNMRLQEKYQSVLSLGEKLGVKDGSVEEADGKLKVGGTVNTQYEKDLLWNEIKKVGGNHPNDVSANIKVADTSVYAIHEVVSGDTLGAIAKTYLGSVSKYMDVFNANKDILDNPDMIKVGQKVKIPNS